MTSHESSKQTAATATAPRTALAQTSNDLPSLAAALGSSLSPRIETSAPHETSAELDYGCVDWFIYGTDTRVGAAPLTG